MSNTPASYQSVLDFWFKDHSPQHWFTVDEAFDAEIKQKFGALHKAARACELVSWRKSAHGRLAEIIVLDQFSRNLFRGTAEAFASDGIALVLAQEAVALGIDNHLEQNEKWVLYLPYMHSESAFIHETAVELFSELGLAEVLDFEFKHKEIIDRFGRYPHRNKQLGRQSTPDEEAFLKQPDSGF
jgi:uncharacterized protein (DUF924 family)